MQKAYCKKLGGVLEHNELLAHLLKDAKRSQRSIVVTLLDLKNAFGEVHHNLIKAALRYHHLPHEFVQIFTDIYENNYITVAVNNE